MVRLVTMWREELVEKVTLLRRFCECEFVLRRRLEDGC